MKKFLLSLTVIASAFLAQAQQYDLELVLINPASGASVPGNQPQDVDFKVVNNSAVTIPMGDTLWFSIVIDAASVYGLDGTVNGANGYILEADLTQGAELTNTTMFGVSIPIDLSASTSADHSVCIALWGVNEAIDSSTGDVNDSNFQNNFDCYTSATVGIEELATSNVVAFPNPAIDVLNIKSATPVETLTIYGLDGKVVATASTNSVDVSNLMSGVYVYEVKTVDGAVIRETFVKK